MSQKGATMLLPIIWPDACWFSKSSTVRFTAKFTPE